MKLPGRAWLEFEVEPSQGGSVITKTSTFKPCSLSGSIYWYIVYPLRRVVFAGMLDGVVRAALSEA